jgi:TetR/AcrR family transcriptional regulator, fatty acid metabolism regulator protein
VTGRPARRRDRARLPPAQRSAEIMRCARTLFCERGFEHTSTAEIARRAGVVEGTLYRYFPTKRDLLVRVVESFYEEILADYERQLQGVRGTWNRLRFLIWKHLSVMHGQPAMCRLIVHELRPSTHYRKSSVFELNRRYTERTLAVVKEGIAAGELRSDVPLQVVRDLIFGCAEHHTWAYLRGEGQFSPERSADTITDLVYRGLAQERSARAVAGRVQRLEQAVERLEGLRGRRRSRRAAVS